MGWVSIPQSSACFWGDIWLIPASSRGLFLALSGINPDGQRGSYRCQGLNPGRPHVRQMSYLLTSTWVLAAASRTDCAVKEPLGSHILGGESLESDH